MYSKHKKKTIKRCWWNNKAPSDNIVFSHNTEYLHKWRRKYQYTCIVKVTVVYHGPVIKAQSTSNRCFQAGQQAMLRSKVNKWYWWKGLHVRVSFKFHLTSTLTVVSFKHCWPDILHFSKLAFLSSLKNQKCIPSSEFNSLKSTTMTFFSSISVWKYNKNI